MEELPVFALFQEPLHYHQDFFQRAQAFSDECLSQANDVLLSAEKRAQALENLTLASKALVLIYLLSGEFPNYVTQRSDR